ncbi:hypothetical protein F5Y10DRAFT_272573 [Nemania abortiva]|nr:hypothetical protein F5Y10DRAFT_272573 [Nemania abortiva]
MLPICRYRNVAESNGPTTLLEEADNDDTESRWSYYSGMNDAYPFEIGNFHTGTTSTGTWTEIQGQWTNPHTRETGTQALPAVPDQYAEVDRDFDLMDRDFDPTEVDRYIDPTKINRDFDPTKMSQDFDLTEMNRYIDSILDFSDQSHGDLYSQAAAVGSNPLGITAQVDSDLIYSQPFSGLIESSQSQSSFNIELPISNDSSPPNATNDIPVPPAPLPSSPPSANMDPGGTYVASSSSPAGTALGPPSTIESFTPETPVSLAPDSQRWICDLGSCHHPFSRRQDLVRHRDSVHFRRRTFVCGHAGCRRHVVGFPRKDKRDEHERRVHGYHA